MAKARGTEGNPIQNRLRHPTEAELLAIPWLSELETAARRRTERAIVVADVDPGELLCRVGGPPNYWFGVITGLLKMSNDSADGGLITYSGLPPGGWFGEGTLLKREPYRYNIQALRRSLVAGLPSDDFHALLDSSIHFNRFIMNQFNERLGQFIAAHETDRLNNPDSRVARNLAGLFNPVLFPGASGNLLRITQQEFAYLVGLSRQRVNEALLAIQARGVIRIEYGGLRVLDLQALRQDDFGHRKTGRVP
jgi:CRP/FNR family cyclic AMP-dependent transcriptional regulator